MLKNFKYPSISKNKKYNNFEEEINILNENIILLKNIDVNDNPKEKNINKTQERKKHNKLYTINRPIFKTQQTIINPLKKSKSTKQIEILNRLIRPRNTIKITSILKNAHKMKKNDSYKVIFSLPSPKIRDSPSNLGGDKSKSISINNISSKMNNKKKLPPINLGKIYNLKFKSIIKDNQYIQNVKNPNELSRNFNNNEQIYNLPLSDNNKKNNLANLNNSNNLFDIDYKFNLYHSNKIDNKNIIDIHNKEKNEEELDIISHSRKSFDINRDKEDSKSYNSHGHINKNINISKILINKLLELKNDNIKLNKEINNCKYKFDEMNFNLGTQLKYSKWKYEISDYDKYFIDIDNFGEREKEEIERRKTFYDILEDAVESISEKKKQKKDLSPRGINTTISEQKKNIIKKLEKKNLPDSEIAVLKHKMSKLSLDKINTRKILEKEKRKKINELLNRSFRDSNDGIKFKF